LDEGGRTGVVVDDQHVDFLLTGDAAAGEFRCSECGYGVSINSTLPRCPMCRGTAWEPAPPR
jgi:rubrerythrin